MCAVLRLVGHGHGNEEKMSYIGTGAELVLDTTKKQKRESEINAALQ